tara:strand:- start:2325 stop:2978 length:654 start_codon:yes stop_codon:yes gene_type:complete
MRYLLVLTFVSLSAQFCLAQQEITQNISSDQRIAQLEAKVSQLEAALKPLLIEYEIKLRKNTARQAASKRMRLDQQTHTIDELKAMEGLYQLANKNLRDENAKSNLEKVIADYPKSNRAGCASVYLGQITAGDDQIKHLKQAIATYSDCYYGNGVQVGAYARLLLATRYAHDGKNAEAIKLLDELTKDYPRSLNHKGQPLEISVSALRNRIAQAETK